MAKMIDKPILVISLLLTTILLTGCLGWDDENGGEHAVDSDGDGYPDDVDDFPTDSNLHKKVTVWDSWRNNQYWEVLPDKYWDYKWNVESDDKYVFIVATGDIAQCQETITLETPASEKAYGCIDNERFTVTSENWGEWKLYVYNQQFVKLDIWLKIKIYK